MTSKYSILVRVYVSYLLLTAFSGVILYYTLRIQFFEGDYWRKMAMEQTTAYRKIPASRGNIYAADGNLLATSVPVYDIVMDPNADGLTRERWNKNIDSLAYMLSETFKDKSEREYRNLLNRARRNGHHYIKLQRKVSYEVLKKVKKFPLFRLGQNRGGLLVEEINVRENPFGMLAFRTIGLYRENGKSVGIEAGFDKFLKGKNGSLLMQKIMGGHWIPVTDQNDIDPSNGLDVITSIDMNMQDITEQALAKVILNEQASYGCAILMETSTGYIKAMANLARTQQNEVFELRNFAIDETTEPGSTFKLASVLSLLEDDAVGENETVDSENGSTQFSKRIMEDSEHGGHGMLTLSRAFELSSNVGISKFIWNKYRHRPGKFITHLKNDFHLADRFDLNLPCNANPVIKNPQSRYWSETTLPWMSIGYDVMVTPLNILTLYNAIANGGKMMKPQIVMRVENTGKLIQEFLPVVVNKKMVKETTLKKILPMLTGVVERGTATNIKSDLYTIAGKTGTAKIVINGDYQNMYKSSFCGFFPADQPAFTLLVMIFNPTKGKYYGSQVAGPVFREISDKIYAKYVSHIRENIVTTNDNRSFTFRGNLERISYSLNKNGIRVNSHVEGTGGYVLHGKSTRIFHTNLSGNVVPEVRGMKLRDAILLLEKRGLRVEFSNPGKVINQSITAGTALISGSKIYLETQI